MRAMARITRSRKRRPITRRDWRSGGRAARTRVWTGSRARVVAMPLFLPLKTQHMRTPLAIEWLGAGAMLLGILSWAMLAAMLGA